jgi:hypothetical protein
MGAIAMKRRSDWAELQNEALAAAGHEARVDHRSKRSRREASKIEAK